MTEINNRIEEVKRIYRESRRIIYAHAKNEGMSPTERRENIELEEDNFADQICQLFPQPLEEKELREKALLTDEERKQIPAGFHYLLEYKEELDWLLRLQQNKDFALLQPKIGEAKREEREKALSAMEIYDTEIKPNPYTTLKQALKGGEDDSI